MTTTTDPTTAPTPVITYANRPPFMRQFNWRILIMLAVFGVLVGYPVFTYVKAQMNGGIEHTAYGEKVDLKAMGNFPFNDSNGTIADVPKQFRDLDGKEVMLQGFVYSPNTSAGGATQFQFVYNVSKCCFAGPPQVQERIFGIARGGAIAVPDQYTMVQLNGTLHVNVVHDRETGKVSSVYVLDVKGEKFL